MSPGRFERFAGGKPRPSAAAWMPITTCSAPVAYGPGEGRASLYLPSELLAGRAHGASAERQVVSGAIDRPTEPLPDRAGGQRQAARDPLAAVRRARGLRCLPFPADGGDPGGALRVDGHPCGRARRRPRVHGQQGPGHGPALRRDDLLSADARADRVHGVHLHAPACGPADRAARAPHDRVSARAGTRGSGWRVLRQPHPDRPRPCLR